MPDYFLGNNINALLTEQSDYLNSSLKTIPASASTIPDWRAWLVIARYLAVFLGATWWAVQKRDITN